MNIHEYQAKELLRELDVPVPKGVAIFNVNEIKEKIKLLNADKFVIKAQIHSGGRGKAGGIKIIKNKDNLLEEAKKMFGKNLVTHQTGPKGKKVQRIYIEEASSVKKEFFKWYLIFFLLVSFLFLSWYKEGKE